MTKSLRIELDQIADRSNLELAFFRASRGKKNQLPVRDFALQLDANLNRLAADILSESVPYNRNYEFVIRDPKVRRIQSACFEDRVLHHAIFNLIGENLDRALVDSTYACRVGKGVHLAVTKVQCNLRRFSYYAKIDIASYFANIQHKILVGLLERKFRGLSFIDLLKRVISSGTTASSVGLPIGSLSSQYFANFYLDFADRWLLETVRCRAHVRYMDDILWWADDPFQLRIQVKQLTDLLLIKRGLKVKPTSVQVQASARGVSFCGFRIRQGVVLASKRKLKRYRRAAHVLKRDVVNGMDEPSLQKRFDQLQATVAHCQTKHGHNRFWQQEDWVQQW